VLAEVALRRPSPGPQRHKSLCGLAHDRVRLEAKFNIKWVMASTDAPASMPLASPVLAPHTVRFGFDYTYACLEQRFYARLAPKPVAAPRLVKRSVKLAPNLGIDADALMSAEGIDILGATE
jgi:hypothetical protein